MPGTARQYLIQDPCHDYAIRFLDLLRRRYGWQAVCMYTSPAALRVNARDYPQLQSPELVAGSYRVTEAGVPAFIDHLRSAHDIRAVVPHFEPSVLPSVRIAAALGLTWAQPDVMSRFRDKCSLKAHLHDVAPDLRVNLGHLVASPAEALAVAARHDLKQFVLKPNDGFGNVNIGFFSIADDELALARYWTAVGDSSLLLEEYVSGEEYHCDGQVDAHGTPTVVDVSRYVRVAGAEKLKLGSCQIPHTSGTFRAVAGYTERVVRASGLRRSPFHAEVKVDQAGPCLIECAARLIGNHVAPVINLAHGGSLDVFDLAAHYYMTDEPYGDPGLNWTHYDAHPHGISCGLAERTERIYSVAGLAAVERLPEFRMWLKRPEVGERLHVTRDIFGQPYIAVVRGTAGQDLEPTIRQILRLVAWNTRRRTPAAVAEAGASFARRRLRQLPTAWELRMRRFS